MLARSARGGRPRQPYVNHVDAVVKGVRERASKAFSRHPRRHWMISAAENAAILHDLQKLTDVNQETLNEIDSPKKLVDHDRAGPRVLASLGHVAAAIASRCHHAPMEDEEFLREIYSARKSEEDGLLLRLHQDEGLPVVNEATEEEPLLQLSLLDMRMLISCLVDADREDAACYDRGKSAEPAPVDWSELEKKIEWCVATKRDADGERNALRSQLHDDCASTTLSPWMALPAPTGTGKTLSFLRLAARQAREAESRRIIVVAPFVGIVSEIARVLRDEVWADGRVVSECHHRTDFDCSLDLVDSVLWRCPIVVTSAVALFDVITSNSPGGVRRLHQVANSTIVIDEVHSCMPAALWPIACALLATMTRDYGCRVIFSSGTLPSPWSLAGTRTACKDMGVPLPEVALAPSQETLEKMGDADRGGTKIERISDPLDVEQLARLVEEEQGPVVVVLNTVERAARVAHEMDQTKRTVFHLSSALTPRDWMHTFKNVCDSLDKDEDFVLVATSCVECGLDLDFAAAFRDECSVINLAQIRGRVDREMRRGDCVTYSFRLEGLPDNPIFEPGKNQLAERFDDKSILSYDWSFLSNECMKREWDSRGGKNKERLSKSESKKNAKAVREGFRIITNDHQVVMVADEALADKLERHKAHEVPGSDLQMLSVSLPESRARQLKAKKLSDDAYGEDNAVYLCPPGKYDQFLGYWHGLIIGD